MISDPDQKSQFTILHKHEANYVEQFLMKKNRKIEQCCKNCDDASFILCVHCAKQYANALIITE